VAKSPATFTFLAQKVAGLYYYYATVVASTTLPAVTPTGTLLTVSSALTTPTVTLTPTGGIDQGQTTPLSVAVVWTLGSAPYKVTLYSGVTAATCTTQVASASGINTPGYTFHIASPSTTTFFCVTVTDSSVPTSVGQSVPTAFSVDSPPSIELLYPTGIQVSAGGSATITATIVATGVPPDFAQWFLGPTCTAANAITSPAPTPGSLTYITGVLTASNTYSVELTDSSPGTPALSSCASVTVTVGDGPTAVATDQVTGLTYVTVPQGPSISVIDSDSNQLVTNIALPAGAVPEGIAVNSGTAFGYVTYTLLGVGNVCMVDLVHNTLGPCSVTGAGPEGVAVNNALGQVYVAANGANDVDVFSLVLAPIATVPVGAGPSSVAFDPNTGTVYVTDNSANTVSVIQQVPGPTFHVSTPTVGFMPAGVAVDPSTDNVYVANSGSGTVSVLNGFSFNVIATIKTGGMPDGVAIDTAKEVAYVSDGANGDVIPINLSNFTPGTAIAVGSGPSGISYFLNPVSALPNLVYVANSGANTVSVINAATGKVIATIFVP